MLALGRHLLTLLMLPVERALLDAGLPPRLQVLSPTEAFTTYFKVAVAVALVAAGPIIVWQLWRFIAPGLYESERRFARLLVPFSVLLTIVGVTFLYFVVLPMSLTWLIGFGKGIDLSSSNERPAWIADPSPTDPNGSAEPGTGPGSGSPGHSETQPADGGTLPGKSAGGDTGSDGDTVANGDTPPADVLLAEVPVLDQSPVSMRTGDMFIHGPTLQLWVMLPGGQLVAADLRPIGVPFEQQFQLRTYINFVFVLIVGFAIAFQLPLVLLLLGWVNLVTADQLAANRKFALLGMFVVGAVMTPPDVVSQIALGLPLFALYELSIWLLRFLPASRVAAGKADPGAIE